MLRGVRRNVVVRGQTVPFYASAESWQTPVGVRRFQIFVVGGGASGRLGVQAVDGSYSAEAGGGGGSGYTNTGSYVIDKPTVLCITIGPGGAQVVGRSHSSTQNAGNTTSVTGTNINISAGGGTTNYPNVRVQDLENYGWSTSPGSYSRAVGSDGGSGGGTGKIHQAYSSFGPWGGASDGGGGYEQASIYHASASSHDKQWHYDCGRGQGRTTRAFAEGSGTLFAYGGNGSDGASGTANTGNGGGGSYWTGTYAAWASGAGGSGLVLIRWNNGGR